jgi:predicted nucleotidyltransferase
VDFAHPYRLIANQLDGSVLAVLSATTRPLTGREVARLAPEGSQAGIWKALTRLSDAGLVDREEAGSALLYSLNRDHLAAPSVEHLMGLRAALRSRLEEIVRSWTVAPIHASMFGSTVRGDSDIDSDIDLFLVRPNDIDVEDARWRDQIDSLSSAIRRWTGNRAGISEVSESDLDRLRDERPAVVEELLSDAVTLSGPAIDKLLRGGAA